MSHVMGYTGREEARPRLLECLAHLPFRAPDSAGVCLLPDGGLELFRVAGRMQTLRLRINGHGSAATAGIAHTHGRVFEHPLVSGDVAIAFHGSIGNRAPSLSDEEFVARLVARTYDGDLARAVRAAHAQLHGTFAFLAVHGREPGTIAGARRGFPLLAAVGDGETYLASSPAALAGRDVIEIGEVALANAGGLWAVA